MEIFQDSSMINYQSPGSGYPWEPGYDSHFMPVYNMLSGFGYSDESDLGYPDIFGPSLNDEGQMAGAFPPMNWEQRSPLSQLQAAFSATPTGSSQSQFPSLQYIAVGSRQETNLAIISTLSPEIHIRSLLRHAGKVLSENARDDEVDGLPSSEDVLDRLLSLLPESATEHNSDNTGQIVRRDAIFDSPFHNALLYSIANGFAGIRDIPPGAVLRMFKEQPGMTNRIIDCLESCPLAIAKSIADNLFRSAIEACDEEAVNFILRATRKSPYKIDLNAIVCKLHGSARLFTPIELAAKLRHLGIVQALITAGVDINHTKETDRNGECGPLELAIRKGGKYEPLDMVLVQSLLSAGSEVRLGLIEAIVPWGQDKPLRNLIELLPRSEHKELFQGRVLTDIAQFLERGSAAEIIQRVVMYCISSGCNRCWDENPKVMQKTLSWAARRANRELVGILLPYTAVRRGALAAAIRSLDEDLIERFLEEDPSMGGPPCYLFDNPGSLRSFGPDYSLPCTPLAEAIRSQNPELIERLERREALSFVKQEGHFEAAIFAAAEVGNCVYMEKLMQLVPDKRGVHLTPALNIAIRKNENKAALLLLCNGADVNKRIYNPNLGLSLVEALHERNKEVVYAILESDVDLYGFSLVTETTVMEAAASWGHKSIIRDLILMGADVDGAGSTTSLSVAVSSRDYDVVLELLRSGASPNAQARGVKYKYPRVAFGKQPLTAAIDNNDGDMFELLISAGADVANEDAFLSAIRKNLAIFESLIHSFSVKYPSGKAGFGGTLLIEALERGDSALLHRLLAAKFDVNSLSKRENGFLSALGFAIGCWKQADESTDMVQKLIDHGDADSIVFKRYLRAYGRSNPLKTALLVAVETRRVDVVSRVLEGGADVNRKARIGLKRTPLQRACELGSFKIVQLLLEKGADVNQEPADRGGGTALQLAAISGSVKIVQLLLSRGALCHAPPAKVGGKTALEAAAENGCLELIRILWNAGGGQFSREQIQKAKDLALDKGHRGCADYLASLFLPSALSLL